MNLSQNQIEVIATTLAAIDHLRQATDMLVDGHIDTKSVIATELAVASANFLIATEMANEQAGRPLTAEQMISGAREVLWQTIEAATRPPKA